MTEKILLALRENNVDKYFITETKKSSAELFFIKKRLDLSRGADLCDYTLNLYRDITKDGKTLTGAAQIKIELGVTKEELDAMIKNAYDACEYAANPAYSFDAGVKETVSAKEKISLNDAALKLAAALFENDTQSDAFINSAEIFVYEKHTRIIGSNGCDVSYTVYSAEGEFVAQSRLVTDVEMHHTFSYDDIDTEALSQKVKEALETVKSRSAAQKTTPKGTYRVILSDKSVETVMEYYAQRAAAAMIYPGYSPFKKDTDVMGETVGDRVDITLKAKEPFSSEGIPMRDITLTENGVLKAIHGNTRMCSYLGEKPTGEYRAAKVECGSMSYDDMKGGRVLQPVSFSDFQMDAYSGYFGGEIRLAYLFEDGKMTPVTGGSINGDFIELQKNMRLSSEKQKSSTFEGPKYIMLDNVAVNGE